MNLSESLKQVVFPSQTNQAGEVLKTDGSVVSWEPDLQGSGGGGTSTYTIVSSNTTLTPNTNILINSTLVDSYQDKVILALPCDMTSNNIPIDIIGRNVGINSAVLSNTQAKTGDASIYFANSVTNYVTFDSGNYLEFGSDDFCLEFWWYPTGTGRQYFYALDNADYWFGIDFNSVGTQKLGLWASSNGTSWDMINADGGGNGICATTVSQTAWHHVAATRSGNVWRVFLDGVKDLEITVSGSIINKSANAKRFGKHPTAGFPVNGYIDQFRITKGVARYTTDFTPSSSSFISSAITLTLPALPSSGDTINFKQIGGWQYVTLNPGGNTIDGASGNTTLNPNVNVELVYSSGNWNIIRNTPYNNIENISKASIGQFNIINSNYTASIGEKILIKPSTDGNNVYSVFATDCNQYSGFSTPLDFANDNIISFANNSGFESTVKKFGSESIKTPGSGDYFYIPSSTLFDYGASPFCIEMWMYCTSFTGNNLFYSRQASTYGIDKEMALYFPNSGSFELYYGIRGVNSTARNFTLPSTISLNTWFHIAFSRDSSNVMRVFLNGVASSNTYTDGVVLNNPSSRIRFSGSDVGDPSFFGYYDDIRITKGVARYTSDFTPVTSSYFPSAITVTLPTSPSSGDVIKIKHITKDRFCYINPNGSTINALSSNSIFGGGNDLNVIYDSDSGWWF